MPKKAPNLEASAFGERLRVLMLDRYPQRRGAGAYLARRYKVSTVTANSWLKGEYRPETEVARRIAEDHGSTFDALYFGKAEHGGVKEGRAKYGHNQDLIADVRQVTLALAAMADWIRETRPVEAPLLEQNLQKLARLDGSQGKNTPIGVMLTALRGERDVAA